MGGFRETHAFRARVFHLFTSLLWLLFLTEGDTQNQSTLSGGGGGGGGRPRAEALSVGQGAGLPGGLQNALCAHMELPSSGLVSLFPSQPPVVPLTTRMGLI